MANAPSRTMPHVGARLDLTLRWPARRRLDPSIFDETVRQFKQAPRHGIPGADENLDFGDGFRRGDRYI
jgi:hypothetical protein